MAEPGHRPADGAGWRPWREAWQQALYGPDGFYRSAEGPAGHFGTSANQPGGVCETFAAAVLRLAERHGCTTVVDIGAGRGELVGALARLTAERGTGGLDLDVDRDLELVGVDVVPRPTALDAGVRWLQSPGGGALPATLDGLRDALVLANEWLDVVPLDVLEVDARGVPRLVEVDRSGRERLGPVAGDRALEWCRAWWPVEDAEPGSRVEVGLTRDEAWRDLVGRVESGVCVAVDYGHRRTGRPAAGSLAGHRAGRLVPPRPDGTCDLTADVALDSLTGHHNGIALSTQREALIGLGVDATRPAPPAGGTGTAPDTGPGVEPSGAAAYLRGLQRAGAAAELLDPDGLGGFGWVQARVVTGQPEPSPARVGR